jgi:tRNA(fMet)-specific endonuclease VapC
LDTDILSNLTKRRPSQVLQRRLQAVPADQQFTTTVTVGEMLYGAHRLGDASHPLFATIDGLLARNMGILPFDEIAARAYGSIRAYLERAGTPIGSGDTMIAAIVVSTGFTLVTGNIREFSRVPGLRVENWL